MARHRGTYKPEHPEPYELSRSRLEAFLKCPACFWLDRVRGGEVPEHPRLFAEYEHGRVAEEGLRWLPGAGAPSADEPRGPGALASLCPPWA